MTDNCLQPVQKFGPQPTDDTPLLCLQPRGLAIVPTRYAVVPDTTAFAGLNLPGGMGNKVTDVELKHHKYVLRLMREGFIYIYYHDHPNNKKWDIYEVGEDSTLDQLGVKAFKRGEKKVLLANQNCFFIEKPWDINKVDFAFSEHPWSKETLEQMESDGALRDKRMQTFRPKEWVNSPSYSHGKKLTVDNLEKVLEYSGDEQVYKHLHETDVKDQPISDETGKHNSDTLKLCTSANAFRMRTDEAAEDVKWINLTPNSERNHPMMLALWDAVGITRELGGFALDAAGWVNQYQEQWALELNAIDNINIVRAALETVTHEKNKALPHAVDDDDLMQHLQREEQGIVQKIQMLEHGYRQQGIPYQQFATLGDERYDLYQRNLNATRKRKQEYAQQLKDNRKTNNKRRVTASWEKYLPQINETKMASRAQYHQNILDAVKPLVNQRIQDQIQWLESVSLLNALTEYDQDSKVDRHFFEDIMGDFFSCMNNCDAGEQKLDQWVKAAALTDDNLYWRAIAGNQTQGKDLLTPILAKIKSNNDLLLEHKTILGIDKGIYGQLLEFVRINADSLQTASEVVGQKVPTGGIDKIYSALGSRLITPLIKPGVDTVGNYIVRLLYTAKLGRDTTVITQQKEQQLKELDDIYNKRHGDLNDSIHQNRKNIHYIKGSRDRSIHDMLGVSQGNLAKDQNQLRFSMANEKKTYRRVQLSYTEVLEQVTTSNQELMLKKQSVASSPSTAFGVLIFVMQIASINQLRHVHETKGLNLELAAKYTVALTGAVGTLAGLADNFTQKNSPWSQGLKKAGARMIVVGGVFAAGLDFGDSKKQEKIGNEGLANVYKLKAVLNLGAASLSTASLYAALNSSWEAAWAARLQPIAGRVGISLTGELILSRFFFTVSVWVTLGILAIDIAIMIFSDDDLEDWLQRTQLAKKPEGKAFNDVKDQQKDFENTVNEIFGLKNIKFKELERELKDDHRLTQMQQKEQQVQNKINRDEHAHREGNASDSDIATDTDYQFNRRELARLRTQIQQRKQEITAYVKRYNSEQQHAAANP